MHISTQTDVSWVGAQPVTRKQRPAASVTVTSRPVPSVSRSVGTTTRAVDVKYVVPPKSSPPKKDTKSSKPSSPKVSPVHESDATILLLKHTREKLRRIRCTCLVSLGSYQITLYLVFLYVSLYLIMYFLQFKWFLINLSLATCILRCSLLLDVLINICFVLLCI